MSQKISLPRRGVDWPCRDLGDEDAFRRILCTSAGALPRSGTLAAPVIVMGGHEQAAGGDGCLAITCGMLETSGQPLMGVIAQSWVAGTVARPQSRAHLQTLRGVGGAYRNAHEVNKLS